MSILLGSTGRRPRGVMWNHRCEWFGIRHENQCDAIAPTDRVRLLPRQERRRGRDMFFGGSSTRSAAQFSSLEAGWLANVRRLGARGRHKRVHRLATVFRPSVSGAGGTENSPPFGSFTSGGERFKNPHQKRRDLFRRHFRRLLFVSRYSISETQAVSYFSEPVYEKFTVITFRWDTLEGNEVLSSTTIGGGGGGRKTAAG